MVNTHRGLGKSFLGILLAIERALRYPNQQCRVGAPDRKQCGSYARPILRQILALCPPELQPRKVDDTWFFHNPRWNDPKALSELHLIGCKEDAESQRGPRSDYIFLDEVRNIENLDYVVVDIFGFHTVGRQNPLMVICSTPPDSGDHPFSAVYVPEAAQEKRYIEIPVTANKDWRSQDDRALAKLCRGKDTVAWKREALCQLESNPDRLICPEFMLLEDKIVVESHQRPDFFYPFMYIDTGWVDFTALVWAYVDWKEQLLIVEKTILFRKKHTGYVAKTIRETEKELYGDDGPYHPITRVGDLTPQQLDDLEIEYGITILPAKDRNDPDANIASLRTRIFEEKIRILRETNAGLISQLRNGVRNEKTGKIDRIPDKGHWDAGMALAYGVRETEYHTNPFPRAAMVYQNRFYGADYEKEPERLRITRNPIQITRRRIR